MSTATPAGTKTQLLEANAKLADLELKDELKALIQAAKDDMAADLATATEAMNKRMWQLILAVAAISGGGVTAQQFLP